MTSDRSRWPLAEGRVCTHVHTLRGGRGRQRTQQGEDTVLSELCSLASRLHHKGSLGCLVLTARVTPSIFQSAGASLAPCRGCDPEIGSLNALVVTIVNSGSIVRSLWLFITSLFAGASAQRSIDSEMAGPLITVSKQGSLTPSAQLQGTLTGRRLRSTQGVARHLQAVCPSQTPF